MEHGTKLRILYLYQHLVQHTDAEHTLSTAGLMKILKEDYIRELLDQGVSISEIARIYKTHRNTVSKFIKERL